MENRKVTHMPGRYSRNKGKAGEREFTKLLKQYGFNAQRGVQYKGTPDSPDVIGIPGFHIEVKRTERLHLYDALKQSISESNENEIPIVAHRKNREEWIVILRATDFLEMVRKNE